MNQWTDSAKARLDSYSAKVKQSVLGSGADATEVADDLTRHVIEEVQRRNLAVVTESDVEQVLAQVGIPEPAQTRAGCGGPTPEKELPARAKPGAIPGGLLLVFGVLIPAGTVVFEFLTGASAATLFDPLPTLGHVLLTLLVPLSNLAIWISLRRSGSIESKRLAWTNAGALGVGLVYALLYLPFAPFACIGVIVYGLGLVPLSPITAFISAIALRLYLRRAAGPLPGLFAGMAAGILILAIFTIPLAITKLGLRMAISESEDQSSRGISLLRTWGDQEEILRACYGRAGRAGEFYAFARQATPDEARIIYYRITGKPFNSVPPPKLYAGRARWSVLEEEFTWDEGQGGDFVAGRVKGLSLVTSRQDGVLDPDAATAYTEWTMEFKNDSRLQREARAQILLPPGAVVSRLTLWINGEEREAAFGGRDQVKTAYKAVVQRRRDPVLVTTCGPDRVLMQCFPVAPSGGRMKVRLGITAPLTLTNLSAGIMPLPSFLERNFTVAKTFEHSLWFDSPRRLSSGNALTADNSKPGLFSVRGNLNDGELGSNVLRVERDAAATKAWAKDSRDPDGRALLQAISPIPVKSPSRVVFVLDSTVGMKTGGDALSQALAGIPAPVEFAVILARDGWQEFSPLLKAEPANLETVSRRLRRLRYTGGHDNVPALIKAWDLAAGVENGVVIWIHGSQPALFDAAEQLRQRLERRAGPPHVICVPAVSGPNRIIERLDGIASVQSMLRLGSLESDLSRLFGLWKGDGVIYNASRAHINGGQASEESVYQAPSLHLARLWASDEVKRLQSRNRSSDAVKLAGVYQLVTPVSGAVVLETQAQYAEAGLQPVAPDSVPSVPEPSAPALFLAALVIVFLMRKMMRRERSC